ncbi:MAG: hypothetical protein ACM3RP_07255 [Chitinophagales bacterium]
MTDPKQPAAGVDLMKMFPNTAALFKSLNLPRELTENLKSAAPSDPQTTKSILALAQVIEQALSKRK